MRAYRMIWLPVIAFGVFLLASTGCEKGLAPELIAAQDAVANAAAEGAPELCPEKYASAELKLKQAQLLFEDKEEDSGAQAAMEAEALGKEAAECAMAASQPTEAPTTMLPDDLAGYTTSFYFPFNQNVILPMEAKKVVDAASLLTKYQDKFEFWILLEGHADLPGSPEDNRLLTYRRARVVRYLLIQSGVDPVRIVVRPMGEMLAAKAQIESKGKTKKMDQEFRRVDLSILSEDPAIQR